MPECKFLFGIYQHPALFQNTTTARQRLKIDDFIRNSLRLVRSPHRLVENRVARSRAPPQPPSHQLLIMTGDVVSKPVIVQHGVRGLKENGGGRRRKNLTNDLILQSLERSPPFRASGVILIWFTGEKDALSSTSNVFKWSVECALLKLKLRFLRFNSRLDVDLINITEK